MLIPVDLWEEAKEIAAQREATMTELVCQGLELVVKKRRRKK